ncbi:FUSC family protein [Niameybacter massiliensis]|uniref:FUSC family protein n=1 Tax=Holtiella tumoricola TaxID=3018743 RepID=A0AA42DNU3_9FIRM|nr:FUSC family protein [Holtiella tumoricola]
MIIITKQKLIFNLIILVPIMLIVGLYSSFFGNDNKLVSIICIAQSMMFLKKNLCYDKKTSAKIVLFLYFIISISTIVSQYSLVLGILFNFITIATVMYFTTEDIPSGLYSLFLLFYVFMEGTPIVDGTVFLRVASILVCGILASLIIYKCTPADYTNPTRPTQLKALIHHLKEKEPTRYFFIIRMTLALTIGMALGNIIGLEKGMWINVTILSLTQLSYKETKERMPKRITGTLIGILLFIIVFNLILPPSLTLMGVIIGGYCSSVVSSYIPKVSFNTMLALASAMGAIGSLSAISIRFGYMILGLFITILLTLCFYKREQHFQI